MSCNNCSNTDKCLSYLKERGNVEMAYTQNLTVCELDIVNFCNLNCYACNRFMDVAKTKEMMSVEQIKFFVDESLELNWPWKEIRVMGGEPLLHPKYKEILTELVRLKDAKPDILIKVITNGTGKKVAKRAKEIVELFPGLVIANSGIRYESTHVDMEEKGKRHVIPDFGNMWQAPIDRLLKGVEKGDSSLPIKLQHSPGYIPPTKPISYDTNTVYSCQIHETCGLGISHNGILPCGCGNAIARVAGLDIFFKSLKEVTIEECHKRLELLCALCGRNLNYTVQLQQNMESSNFWKETLKAYRIEEPKHSRMYQEKITKYLKETGKEYSIAKYAKGHKFGFDEDINSSFESSNEIPIEHVGNK